MRIGSARPVATIALALALIVLAVACGESNDDVTLTIGVRNTPEEAILAHIYAQALENAGYEVKTNANVGVLLSGAPEALEKGRISGYPEHLNTALPEFLGRELDEVPADPQKAYQEAKRAYEKEGMTAFPPAPFSPTFVLGALRKTAEKWDLEKVSDLRGISKQLLISGEASCHGAINCVGGLEDRYKLVFEGFIQQGAGTEPFHMLESKLAALAMLPATDGRLATKKDTFVLLEEDKHLLPAGNAIFVTTPKIVEEAGPEFEEAIAAAQKGLTLPVMQELNAKVEIEKQDPKAVAAEYLEQTELDPGA